MSPTTKNLSPCDYLVIGAGAGSLPFIDTLLTELPSVKIVLVDRYSAPGGHWNNDYDYVRLHQPSILYGVASKQLEGNWLKCMLKKRSLPWNYRSTKEELLQYFQEFVDEKVAGGQLEFYPECNYDFDQKLDGEVPGLLRSLSTLAIFFAIVDKDPTVGYEWMKSNRLSFFSIPGFKSGLFEDLTKVVKDGKKLGFTENEIEMFKVLRGKLVVLKDK